MNRGWLTCSGVHGVTQVVSQPNRTNVFATAE